MPAHLEVIMGTRKAAPDDLQPVGTRSVGRRAIAQVPRAKVTGQSNNYPKVSKVSANNSVTLVDTRSRGLGLGELQVSPSVPKCPQVLGKSPSRGVAACTRRSRDGDTWGHLY